MNVLSQGVKARPPGRKNMRCKLTMPLPFQFAAHFFVRTANNVSEMLTALVSEVAGTTLFAYVIGALVTIVLNLDPQTRLRKQKVSISSKHVHHSV